MLNTKSCLASAMIWTAVVAIVGTVLWDAFGWPAPSAVWQAALQSQTADTIKQYQTLVAGVLGFGLASLAYWLNGQQERRSRTRETDSQARALAHALMLETERLESDCDVAAARFASLAEDARKQGADAIALPGGARMILRRSRAGGLMLTELGSEQLARLGTNACSALLMLRNAVADLDREASELTSDGARPTADELSEMARAYSGACLKCARVRPLLWTLARHGVAVADEREHVPMPTYGEVEGHLRSAARRIRQSPGATIIPGPGVASA